MILAAGLRPEGEDLTHPLDGELRRFATPEEVLRVLRTDASNVTIVLLGPLVKEPLLALRRVKTISPDVLVLLVALSHDVPALQHELLLTPQLGEPARVVEEGPSLPRLLREHAVWARERRHNRTALRRANAQLEAPAPPEREPPSVLDELFERAPVAVMLLDDEGNVVHENTQAGALFPRRRGGSRFLERVPVSARPTFEKLLSESGGPNSVRVDLPVRGGGGVRHHDATVTQVQLARRRQGRLLLLHDVTDIVLAQRELEGARAELSRAEKLATIGSLVGGLAHEIRTPLTLVQNHLYLLETRISRAKSLDELRAQAPALLAGAHDGSDRIHALVMDLRRLLRGDEPQLRAVTLTEPVAAAIRLFDATHPAGPRVETELNAGRLLQLDPSQVQQVVINLLENAADASSGSARVRVTTRDVEGGSELMVQDWGVGIPADLQARMFETFVSTKPEGNGLGLNIVRRIAELHKATIRVDSRIGKGTRIFLMFPAPAEDAGDSDAGDAGDASKGR